MILAVSLTFDTFAVSVTGGISLPYNTGKSRKAMIIAFFGLLQAAYLFAGWFVGGKFAGLIADWDHWVAFVILIYLGGRMVFGTIGKKGEEVKPPVADFLNFRKLFVLATATSIDAVAVGASLAMLDTDTARILATAAFTFIATAAASLIGIQGGRKLGSRIGGKAEIWGGLILIFIGMKILIGHLELFA